MSEDTPAEEISRIVHEARQTLRERYGATEVDLNADEVTEWEEVTIEDDEPGGDQDTVSSRGRDLEFVGRDLQEVGREQGLTITLRWLKPELPLEPDRSPIASHTEMLATKIELAAEDYPDAELSAFTNRERVQLNIQLGET